MKSKTKEKLLVWAMCGAFVVVVLLLLFVQPYFEAQAYNRATGSDVSTWDAFWVELRVQADPK